MKSELLFRLVQTKEGLMKLPGRKDKDELHCYEKIGDVTYKCVMIMIVNEGQDPSP